MAADIAVSAALALVEKVASFVDKIRKSPSHVREALDKARTCLERMDAYLTTSQARIDQGNQVQLQARVKQVRDVVHYIEDALDEFTIQVPHHSQYTHWYSGMTRCAAHSTSYWLASNRLSSEIEVIITNKIGFLRELDGLTQEGQPTCSTSQQHGGTLTPQVLEDDEIVGFDVPKQKLIEQLMKGDPKRLTISIVGPGGSGKTTIMRNVYDTKKVQRNFNCRAWIDVLRPLNLENVLRTMLSSFDPKGKRQEPEGTINCLKEKLKLLLQKKKFLVVLDNVWRNEDLESIVNALPNGSPGSKILVSTRTSDVASHSSNNYIHDLSRGLSKQHARYLFCKKAFPNNNNNNNCPQELEEWVEKFLKRCDGLPSAISAVGADLANKRHSPVEWKKAYESFESWGLSYRDLPSPLRSWELSYRDLPSQLKSCFLYFSVFPEDYSIKREKLIRLWIAEGFVKPEGRKTMEDVAEWYLNELVGRNLVSVSSKETDGQVRRCRVSNLVHHFIISKPENFLCVLKANHSTTDSGTKIRRLSVQDDNITISGSAYDLNGIRTLLVFGQGSSNNFRQFGNVLKNFKFLKVLDLQGAPLKKFPKGVVGLTLLRYLSLRETKIKRVPRSIIKLGFLETLDLKHTQITHLPKEICKLSNLRHLLVHHWDATSKNIQAVVVSSGNIKALRSIQKLSLIEVKKRNNRKLIKALGELVDLRKLGLQVDLASQEDRRQLCSSIQKMKHLSMLDLRSKSLEVYLDLDHMESPPKYVQRLHLEGLLDTLPRWIPKLESLSKIALKCSKLNDRVEPLEALESLPNLMELDLVDYSEGEVLKFKAGTFKELILVSIEQFDQLRKMVIENGAMPKLKKLTISKCRNLELVPKGIDGLTSLDQLCVNDMHTKFIAHLKGIAKRSSWDIFRRKISGGCKIVIDGTEQP
ncbi:putative P-loop containing nucleoside triphosphate hydrolase, leucine-rich repeat domain, L [Rosa chinensis]|uniref:Putative P-loop containing nucleoside triphosphate hydrolase, leucine-rich repeat domain, L n=1 Tax=Rosa chinensis TaxID=74649 RepID=A0A2P6Q966_ROSCH|nr:disease resistance protein RPM1 [Rosa chinensis]PRQ30722.1 putative P-loop containing nucleoside triphosphate hydrolase, leucine-rich repeat domain, L [Rosa chinensis]